MGTNQDISAIIVHLFEQADRGIQVFRAEHETDPARLRLIAQNLAASELTGVDMNSMVGRTLGEAMPEFLSSEFPERYLRCARTGEGDHWEVTYADERFPSATWRAKLLPLGNDLVAVIFENITDARETEEALRLRSEELEEANKRLRALAAVVAADLSQRDAQLRAVIESLPATVWTTDRSLTITSITGAGLSLIDIEPSDLVGKGLGEFLGKDGARLLAEHERALDGVPVEGTMERNGRFLNVWLRPLLDSADVVGVIGVGIDTSERRSLEESLQARQRLESIGRLAGGIAHDFNNLLAIVMTSASLLRRGIERGTAKPQTAELILEAAERGSRLTSQLLAFAKKQATSPTAFDLNQVLGRMADLLRRALGDDVRLELRLDEAPAVIVADLGQIEQIIMNLVVNARDAMPEGGTLTISTSVQRVADRDSVVGLPGGEYIRLEIRDQGVGMDPELLTHIFEPFFTTKDTERGTGLGLATVYGHVKRAGGAISVDSEVGEGSRFVILLPRQDQQVASETERDTSEVERRAVATVLVVDDDAAVLRVASDALQDAGITVLAAGSGAEALELARSYGRRIDVLLTDVAMPEMGGTELVAKLASEGPDMAVVYMSGYPGKDFDVGDAEFVAKPFGPGDLVAAVERAATRAKLDS